jgi:DNA modification methylase
MLQPSENQRIIEGDALAVLPTLPDGCVHCVISSPPYWLLRDYQTGTWEGGTDLGCDHLAPPGGGTAATGLQRDGRSEKARQGNAERIVRDRRKQYQSVCRRCGAHRTDRQLGSEPSPDCGTHGQAQCGRCYVCAMVGAFRQVRRVLRDDGTLWLNLGDSYATNPGNGRGGEGAGLSKQGGIPHRSGRDKSAVLPSGNLIGIPWRVALALQADGWILRQDICWAKPAPMPESVRNRCTKSHEYVFLLCKRGGYYYDSEAIKEPIAESTLSNPRIVNGEARSNRPGWSGNPNVHGEIGHPLPTSLDGRNRRSVWTVAAEPFPGAHFAVFPCRLVEPMIKAGTSERGCCAACGAPWRRVVEQQTNPRRIEKYTAHGQHVGTLRNDDGIGGPGSGALTPSVRTLGWYPHCRCDGLPPLPKYPCPKKANAPTPAEVAVLAAYWQRVQSLLPLATPLDTVPAIVLDPFAGAGTTLLAARRLGRRALGIELSPQFADMARKRVADDLPLFNRTNGADATLTDSLPSR